MKKLNTEQRLKAKLLLKPKERREFVEKGKVIKVLHVCTI